jgi:hypothetical protein
VQFDVLAMYALTVYAHARLAAHFLDSQMTTSGHKQLEHLLTASPVRFQVITITVAAVTAASV